MKIDEFGMDTISLAGPLEAKLRAMRDAGFGQVMLSARDVVGHPDGLDAAVKAVRSSALRGTGFQVLCDFEGLSGTLHGCKVDITNSMIEMCTRGCKVPLACSSTSKHAAGDTATLARDLRKLATLAHPYNIKVAYEALSWGRSVNRFTQAWQIVDEANRPNLGTGYWVLGSIRSTSALPTTVWTTWTCWTPNAPPWCSCRTLCGRKRPLSKNA